MDFFDQSLRKLFSGPICPYCATAYDPEHYDFVEDRACCPNCSALYRVGDEHVPDIPDADLDVDISDPVQDAALRQFRSDVERIASETAKATAGASYELYARRFSEACDALLHLLKPAIGDAALAIAKHHGYLDDDATVDGFGPGYCSLTGIDEHCCHCGRHP